MCVTEQ